MKYHSTTCHVIANVPFGSDAEGIPYVRGDRDIGRIRELCVRSWKEAPYKPSGFPLQTLNIPSPLHLTDGAQSLR